MSAKTGRQLAALVQMRLDTDRNTNDTFRLAEKLVDDNQVLEEQIAELRMGTEPVRRRQRSEIVVLTDELAQAHGRADRLADELRRATGAEQIKYLTGRADQLAHQGIVKDNEIVELKSRVRGDLYDDTRRKNEALETEIDRLDSQVERLTIELDATRVIATESLQPGDYAYRSRGNKGIDTIDRLRGPAWTNMPRGQGGTVHRVAQNIRAGEEAELFVFANGAWSWRKRWGNT